MARGVHRVLVSTKANIMNNQFESTYGLLGTLRRKRSRRSRDRSLCRLYSQYRLGDLAVHSDSCEGLCAWSRAVRSVPRHCDAAPCGHVIQLESSKPLEPILALSS